MVRKNMQLEVATGDEKVVNFIVLTINAGRGVIVFLVVMGG